MAYWIRGSCLFFLRKLAEETKGFREPILLQTTKITGERRTGSVRFHKFRTNHYTGTLEWWDRTSVLVGPIPPLISRRGMDIFLSLGLILMCVQCSAQKLSPKGKNVCLNPRYWYLVSFSVCYIYLFITWVSFGCVSAFVRKHEDSKVFDSFFK